MIKKPGYILEHCRPNCPRVAKDWQVLQKQLEISLDSLEQAEVLADKIEPLQYHHIIKISTAGCPNGCSQPLIKDFGITGYVTPKITDKPCLTCGACVKSCQEKALSLSDGKLSINTTLCLSCGDCLRACPTGTLSVSENGWILYLGGRVGRHPHFAESVSKAIQEEDVVKWVTHTLKEYIKHRHPHERLSNYLERYGIMHNTLIN